MARKEVMFKVENPASRDFGKEFIITEMSAWDAEKLGEDLFRIMGEQGFTGIPTDVISMGCAGFATYGLPVLTSASPEVSLALRDRLISTVEISITHDNKTTQRAVNGPLDFEEVETIRALMDKVFEVNFSFLAIGGESTSHS